MSNTLILKKMRVTKNLIKATLIKKMIINKIKLLHKYPHHVQVKRRLSNNLDTKVSTIRKKFLSDLKKLKRTSTIDLSQFNLSRDRVTCLSLSICQSVR